MGHPAAPPLGNESCRDQIINWTFPHSIDAQNCRFWDLFFDQSQDLITSNTIESVLEVNFQDHFVLRRWIIKVSSECMNGRFGTFGCAHPELMRLEFHFTKITVIKHNSLGRQSSEGKSHSYGSDSTVNFSKGDQISSVRSFPHRRGHFTRTDY